MDELTSTPCLQDFIEEHFTKNREKVLLEDIEGRESTYGEIFDKGVQLAERLSLGGVKEGDRILILLEDRRVFMISFLATLFCGAIAVIGDHRLSKRETKFLAKECRASLMLSFNQDFTLFKKVEQAKNQPFSIKRSKRDDVCLISYGLTLFGNPKAMHTHAGFLTQLEYLARSTFLEQDERVALYLPYYLPLQTTLSLFLAPLRGYRIVTKKHVSFEPSFKALKALKPTTLIVKSKGLRAFHEQLFRTIHSFSRKERMSLKFSQTINSIKALLGFQTSVPKILKKIVGEKLTHISSVSLNHNLVELNNLRALGFFVSASSSSYISSGLITHHPKTKKCVRHLGEPLGDTEIKVLVDQDGEHGEVFVKGRSIASLESGGEFVSLFAKGTYENGVLFLSGKKQVYHIKKGGELIDPSEIERAFDAMPKCEELAVFTTTETQKKEVDGSTITLLLRPTQRYKKEDLMENIYARNRLLPEHLRVCSLVIWPEKFPRTQKLQIKRGELEAQITAKIHEVERISL